MSLRDEWDNCKPSTRAFYQGFADRMTNLCSMFIGAPPYDWYGHFFGLGQSWVVRSPYGLWHINMLTQDYWWGGHEPDRIYWCDEPDPLTGLPTLPGDAWYGFPVYDQLEAIPTLAINYPRPKYRVRKSYWTGISRKRRNI